MLQTIKIQKKEHIKSDLWVILICFFLFQDILQEYFAVFQYLDEFVSVGMFSVYIISILRTGKVNKSQFKLLVLPLIIICVGLFGNLNSGISRTVPAILTDIGNTFKFLLIFLGSLYVSPNIKNREYIVRKASNIAKVYILVLFTCACINIVKDVGMSYELRYGLRSFAFIYGIPGVVINHCTYILLLLMADSNLNNKKNSIYIILTLLTMASTLRSRGLGLIALFIMLYYLLFVMKKKNIQTYIGIIALVLGFLGSSQLEMYFLDSTTAPRALFLRNALLLMQKYVPWGTGFATFGSFAAANYYSPLYYTLGFSNRYGMGPEGNLFLCDNYWPTIGGQFGIIGLVLFVLLLFECFRYMVNRLGSNNCKAAYLACWFVVLDALMSSIQSSYISHYSMVALLFVYMICWAGEPSKNRNLL